MSDVSNGYLVPEWEYWCLVLWFLLSCGACLGVLMRCCINWCCNQCLDLIFGFEDGSGMAARDVPLVDFDQAN